MGRSKLPNIRKKNRMGISCEVADEANFKAICDVLNSKATIPAARNGKHSKVLVDFMKRYFREKHRSLSVADKALFDQLRQDYIEAKNKNGIV